MSKSKIKKEYKTEKEKFLEIVLKDLYFKPKTENQKKYYDLIEEKEITICSGPAGVGKSMVSIVKALELLKNPKYSFNNIVICKPAVPAEEDLGSLPGDIAQKLDPYLYSSMYLFNKVIGEGGTKTLMDSGYITIMGLGYMRGINIDNSIVIAEEFQNASPKQMKTLLTRIGANSKFIISGDLEQSDKFKNSEQSGLYDSIKRLSNVPEIGIFQFEGKDIVRNKIISIILDKYQD